MKNNFRKQLLINPKFQLDFIRHILSMALIVLLLFYAAVKYMFYVFQNKGLALGLPKDHVFFQFLASQEWTMNGIFAALTIVVVGVLVFYGLHISNRVAGPLYRLQKFLQERSEGNTTSELKFRSDDYFQDLAEVVRKTLK